MALALEFRALKTETKRELCSTIEQEKEFFLFCFALYGFFAFFTFLDFFGFEVGPRKMGQEPNCTIGLLQST